MLSNVIIAIIGLIVTLILFIIVLVLTRTPRIVYRNSPGMNGTVTNEYGETGHFESNQEGKKVFVKDDSEKSKTEICQGCIGPLTAGAGRQGRHHAVFRRGAHLQPDEKGLHRRKGIHPSVGYLCGCDRRRQYGYRGYLLS